LDMDMHKTKHSCMQLGKYFNYYNKDNATYTIIQYNTIK